MLKVVRDKPGVVHRRHVERVDRWQRRAGRLFDVGAAREVEPEFDATLEAGFP